MAALTFDSALDEEHELLDAVVATTSIALENGRLRAELRARLSELQESRGRVLEAGRQERQRLERDLHDGAQVRLVALSMELGMLGAAPGTDDELRTRLLHAKGEVSASLEELRDVARGIYPAVLSAHGLDVALESLAARAPVPVQIVGLHPRAAAARGRGGRLLRHQRGPGQRRQARRGDGACRYASNVRARGWSSTSGTTDGAGRRRIPARGWTVSPCGWRRWAVGSRSGRPTAAASRCMRSSRVPEGEPSPRTACCSGRG